MSDAQILVATNDKTAQVRIVGRATYACSQSLREFATKVIEAGVDRFLVDLSQCVTMDSTFMGTLAMIVTRGRAQSVVVEAVNASDKVRKLLIGLGLKKLFTFSRTTSEASDWTALCERTVEGEADELAMQKAILEAHEALVEVDPENAPRFKDVLEFLKRDIKGEEQ